MSQSALTENGKVLPTQTLRSLTPMELDNRNREDVVVKKIRLDGKVEITMKALLNMDSLMNFMNEDNEQLMLNLSEQILKNDFLIKELQSNMKLLRLKDVKISKLEDKIKTLEEASFDLLSKTTQERSGMINGLLHHHLHPFDFVNESQTRDTFDQKIMKLHATSKYPSEKLDKEKNEALGL